MDHADTITTTEMALKLIIAFGGLGTFGIIIFAACLK